MSLEWVTDKGIEVAPAVPQASVTALDGQSLAVSGKVWLTLSRCDESVHLPEVKAEFLVVEDLTVVDADFLLGVNIITGLGGVSLGYNVEHDLNSVVFEPSPATALTAVGDEQVDKLPRHVTVTENGDYVVLSMADGEAVYDSQEGHWTIHWNWQSGAVLEKEIGTGIGEYSRQSLSEDQEAKFCAEIEMWISQRWLVPYNADAHWSHWCGAATVSCQTGTQADDACMSPLRLPLPQ